MLQLSRPLPADVPACPAGHRPHLVETRGAPRGHRIGTECPRTWHIECGRCQVATTPAYSRAVTESRWRDAQAHPQALIPLSDLGRARACLADTATAA